jgi:peptidoglycan/LPS O-acetylase OafA/YrhL
LSIPIVNHSLKYNPSFDGLRGIAILLVVLFHIWPKYFSFGYVGVDIFFVLSGYLITQIIYTKLQSNSFSFKEFYRNRIRRIFPTMILVLLTTFLIGYLFLFPSELEQLGNHIKSSTFFYQNFRLISEVGYWDDAAQLKPLLHFWSLSIEEQFYIFWPLIIFILYELRVNLFISLLVILLLLITIPLFVNIDTFYHSFSRFWELSFGGLIYASTTKFNIIKQINKLQWAIFIIFIFSIGFAYENTTFNLLQTLLIVVATGLLILNISINKDHKILSFSLLVFLGLISFPLYLWHYIFISYMHIFGLEVQNYGIWLVVFSIFISYITYRYIEVYARKQISYKFSFLLLSIVLIIGFSGLYLYNEKGLSNRNHLRKNDIFNKQFIKSKYTNKTGLALITKILKYNPNNNFIKSTSEELSKKYIMIIGDSHARSSYIGFAKEFNRQGYETLLVANSSCPPYLEGAMGKNIVDIQKCEKKIRNIYTVIKQIPNLKKVIFITRGPVYMHDIGYGIVDSGGKPLNYHFKDFFINKNHYNQKGNFLEVLKKTFYYFSKKPFDFYYLLENPELGFSPKNCNERPFNILPSVCKLRFSDYIARAGEYRTQIQKISAQYSNINLLDPKDLYCDNSYCYAIKDGIMLYSDDDHHSSDGSLLQAKYFIKNIIK